MEVEYSIIVVSANNGKQEIWKKQKTYGESNEDKVFT